MTVTGHEEEGWQGLAREAAALVLRAATDPRFAKDKAQRAVGIVRARYLFRHCNSGARVCAEGQVEVENQGTLNVGDRVTFMAGMIPTRLWVGQAGVLSIGPACVFNYGTVISAHARVQIGAGCLFGSMARLSDTAGGKQGPIVLGDRVWVAHGVVIEPGVTVGDGAVLSAGAVVTRDVPPGHLALGNPARAMKLSTVGAGH